MCAEGATKGLIKRGEVATEMCTKGFPFFIHFCECLHVHAPVLVLIYHVGRLALLLDDTPAQTHKHIMSGLLLTD